MSKRSRLESFVAARQEDFKEEDMDRRTDLVLSTMNAIVNHQQAIYNLRSHIDNAQLLLLDGLLTQEEFDISFQEYQDMLNHYMHSIQRRINFLARVKEDYEELIQDPSFDYLRPTIQLIDDFLNPNQEYSKKRRFNK